MQKVLILSGSSSDLSIAEDGLEILKEFKVPFSLRVASAHRSPEAVHSIVKDFDTKGGEVYICVAGMSAHLAGVVAALTVKPVIAVPVYRKETSGLDALLSMSQMPKGVPVATMAFGETGFVNACLFALQILGLKNEGWASALKRHRELLAKKIADSDHKFRVDFDAP